MRERTPSADDTPKRAPPAPPREAASADVLVDGRSSRIVNDSTRTSSGLSSCTERRVITMVASEQGLDKLRTNQSTINDRTQQQQQEQQSYNFHVNHQNNNNNHHNYQERITGYRSAQTAQDKRSRLSNVINNLRKKVPPDNTTTTVATTTITKSDNESNRTKDTCYSHVSNHREDEARNSVERNLANLEKYVMTVLNGVIKDAESKDEANIDTDEEKSLTRDPVNDKKDVFNEKVEKSVKKDKDVDDSRAYNTGQSKSNESFFEAAVPGMANLLTNDATFDDKKIIKNENTINVNIPEVGSKDCRLDNDDTEKITLSKESNVSGFLEEASVSIVEASHAKPEVERLPKVDESRLEDSCIIVNESTNLITEQPKNVCVKDIPVEKDDIIDETISSSNIEIKRKNNRSLGTLILDRLDHAISMNNETPPYGADLETKGSETAEDSDSRELRTICRDLLNELLNDICQLIDEKPMNNEEKSIVIVENKDDREDCEKMKETLNTSIQCSLPLDKVASILQNCQTSPNSISSTCQSPYQASKTPTKSTSPTVRHLCLYCDRKFLSISLRQRHTERVHQLGGGRRSDRNSRKTTQNCQYCAEKCADNLDSLFQHMIVNHTDKYYACAQCATRYSNRETLVSHMSDTHGHSCEFFFDNRETSNRETPSSLKESSILSTTEQSNNKCARDATDDVPETNRKVEDGSEKRANETITGNSMNKDTTKGLSMCKETISNPGSPEFDSTFYSSVSCNIRENLLHHLDGKLQHCTNTPGGTTSDVKPSYTQQQQQSFHDHSTSNQIQLPIDISLTAATPVYSKEYTSDERENSSEYAQKPGKTGRSHPRRVSFEKYNFPRKYDGKEQWSCSIKDLSKFDISTQLTLRKKQQLIKEKLTANRLNNGTIASGSSGIFQAEIEHLTNNCENDEKIFECLEDFRIPIIEQSNATNSRTFTGLCDTEKLTTEHSASPKSNEIDTAPTEFTAEFNNFLRLKKWNESSAETRNNQEVVYAELTGEWSRPRVYICGACTSRHLTLRELEEHKAASHPNVWCSHLEFTGDQRELYKHLFLPGRSVATSKAKNAILSEKVCTKCSKVCGSLAELHRHILECAGDQAWLLGLFGNGKKKCKWRPFGSRSRRRRQRGMKRNIQNSQTPRVNQPRERNSSGPRVRPSDRESIQKMLANLPPKRASRRVMQDTTVRTQGRLRKMQTRSRPRLADPTSSTLRLSQKAVLRNKLLKNAKSFQRKRCRRDNITAAIESVVKKSEPSKKPNEETENDEVQEEEQEAEGEEDEEEEEEEDDDVKDDSGLFKESRKFESPKAHGEMSKIGKNLESSNRSTKIVRGVRVVSKKRNVKSNNLHNAAVTKSRTVNNRRGVSATGNQNKKNAAKNNDKNIISSVSAENIIDVKSLSPNSSSPSHSAMLRRKKHVDPVVSLHASLKARSQLRTHDGKFARRVDTITRSQSKESPRVSNRRNSLVGRGANTDSRIVRKRLLKKNVAENDKSSPSCSTPEKRGNNSATRETTKKNLSESEKPSWLSLMSSKDSNKKSSKKITSETEKNSKTCLFDEESVGKVTRKSLAKKNSSELEKQFDSTDEGDGSISGGTINDSPSVDIGKSKKSSSGKKTLAGQQIHNVELDLDEAISKNVIDVTRIKNTAQDVDREQRPSRGRRKKNSDEKTIKNTETSTHLVDSTMREIKMKNRNSTMGVSSGIDNGEELSKRASSKDSKIKELKENEIAFRKYDSLETENSTKKFETFKSMDSRQARQERRAGSLEDFSKIRDVPDEVKRLLGPSEDLLTQIGLKTRDRVKKTQQVQKTRVNSPRNKGQKKNIAVNEKEDDFEVSEKCVLRVSPRKSDKKEATSLDGRKNDKETKEMNNEDTKFERSTDEIFSEETKSPKKMENNVGKRRGRIKTRVENQNAEISGNVYKVVDNKRVTEETIKQNSLSVGKIDDQNSEESIEIVVNENIVESIEVSIDKNIEKFMEPTTNENSERPIETTICKNLRNSSPMTRNADAAQSIGKIGNQSYNEELKQIVNKKIDQSIVSRHLDESIEMAIKKHLQGPIETIVEKNLEESNPTFVNENVEKSIENIDEQRPEGSLEIVNKNVDESIEIVDKTLNGTLEINNKNLDGSMKIIENNSAKSIEIDNKNLQDALEIVDKNTEEREEIIEKCVDEKSLGESVTENIVDVAALSFEHLQQESSNSNIDSGKENSSETPVNVSKLKVVRPKKCRGSRRDRAGKRTLNNVIGILTEGVNIPIEVQQSVVLTVQTSIETMSETGNSSNSSQITGNNAAAGESLNACGSVKPNENTDTACSSTATEESEIATEMETTKIETPDKKEECEKIGKTCEDADKDIEKNIQQAEVKHFEPLKNLTVSAFPVKTSNFVQSAIEPTNDIILDLSRRKPRGKGSFLEKIVSKIAKQKDVLLETDVGCLLDNAADELTNILSEINPSVVEQTETARINPETDKIDKQTIPHEKKPTDEKIVVSPKIPEMLKNDTSISTLDNVDIKISDKREKQFEPTEQEISATGTIATLVEEFPASPLDVNVSKNEYREIDESGSKRTSKKRSLDATTPKKNKRKTIDEKVMGEESSEEEICLADIMNLINRSKQKSPNTDEKCEEKIQSGKRKIVEVDKEEGQFTQKNPTSCVETIEDKTKSRSNGTEVKKTKRNNSKKLTFFVHSDLKTVVKDNEIDDSLTNDTLNLELKKSLEIVQLRSETSINFSSETDSKIEENKAVSSKEVKKCSPCQTDVVEKTTSRPARKCAPKKKSLADEHLNLSEDEERNEILLRSMEEIDNSTNLSVSVPSTTENTEEIVESAKTAESFKCPDVDEFATSTNRITRKQSLPENVKPSDNNTIAAKSISPPEIRETTNKHLDSDPREMNTEEEKTFPRNTDTVEVKLSIDAVALENNEMPKSYDDTFESVDIAEIELEKLTRKKNLVENVGDTNEGIRSENFTEDDVQSDGTIGKGLTRRAKDSLLTDDVSPFSDAKLQRKFAVVHTKSGKMLIVEKKKKFTKEAAKFFCEICAASFTRKSSLKKHNSSQSHLLQVSKYYEETEKVCASQDIDAATIDKSDNVSKIVSGEETEGLPVTKLDDVKDTNKGETSDEDETEKMQESQTPFDTKKPDGKQEKLDEVTLEQGNVSTIQRECENSITSTTDQTEDSNLREEKLDDFEDDLLDEEICKITENMTHDEYVLTDHVSPVVPEALSTPVINISTRVSDTPDSIKKINDFKSNLTSKDPESKTNLADEHLHLDSPAPERILGKISSQQSQEKTLVTEALILPSKSPLTKIVKEKIILSIPKPIKSTIDSITSNVEDESIEKTSRSKRNIKPDVFTLKSEYRQDPLSRISDSSTKITVVEKSIPEVAKLREEKLEIFENKPTNDLPSDVNVQQSAKTETPTILDFSNITKKLNNQTENLTNDTLCNIEFDSEEDTLDTNMSDDIRKILDDPELDTDDKQLVIESKSPEKLKKCIPTKADQSLSESDVARSKRNKQKTKTEELTSVKKEKTTKKSLRNKNVTKEIVKRSRTSKPRKNVNSSKTKIDDTSESEYDEKKDVIESQNKNKIVKSVFGRVFGGEKLDKVKEVLEDWVSRSEGDSHDDTQTSIDVSTAKIDKIVNSSITSPSDSKKSRREQAKSLEVISQNFSLSESHSPERERGKKRGRSKNGDVTSSSHNVESNRSNDKASSKSKNGTLGRKKNPDWILTNDPSIAQVSNNLSPGSRCRQSKKRAEERISRAFEDESSIVFDEGELLRQIDSSIVMNNSRNSIERQIDTESQSLENKKRTKHEEQPDKNPSDESENARRTKKSSNDASRLNKERSASREKNSQGESSKDKPELLSDAIRADEKDEDEEDDEEDEDEIALGRMSPLYVCNTPESSIESSSNSEDEERDEREDGGRITNQFKNDKVIQKSPISITSNRDEQTAISLSGVNNENEENALDVPRDDHVNSPSEKSRQGKVLNFDEELFVECCSRLKATTENELRGAKKIKLDHDESYERNDEQERNLRSSRDRWRDVESQNSLGSLLESVNQLLGEEMYSGNRTNDYVKRGRNTVSESSSRSASPDVDTSCQENPGYEDSLDVAFEHNNKLRVKIQQRMRESENLIASTFSEKTSGTSLHRHHHHHHHHHHHRAPNHQRHHETSQIHKRENRQLEHGRKENTTIDGSTIVHENLHNDENYDNRTSEKTIERNDDKHVELDCTGFRNKNPALGGLIDNLLHSSGKHDHHGSTPMNVLAELACARVPTSTLPEINPSLREKSVKSPSQTLDSSPEEDRLVTDKDGTAKKSRNPIRELFERKNDINERKLHEKLEGDVTLRDLNVQRQKRSKKPKKQQHQQDFPLIRKSQLGGMVERKKRREEKKIIASNTIEARIKDIYDFDDDESQEKSNIVMSYRNKNEKSQDIVNTVKTTELDMTDLMTKAIDETLNNGKTDDVLGRRLEFMVDRKFQEIETFPPKTKGALKSFQVEEKQQNRDNEQPDEDKEDKKVEERNEKRVTGPMDDFVERKKSLRKLTEQSISKHGRSKKRSKNSKKKSRNAWYENDSSDEFVTAAKAEDVGVGTTRSQRTCSKGKQNLFAELSTSSESDYDNVEDDYSTKKQLSRKKKNINIEENYDDVNIGKTETVINASYTEDHENVSIIDWMTVSTKNNSKNELEHKKSESEMSDHPLIIDERKNETDETRNSDDDIEARYVPAFELDDLYREDTTDETDEDTNNIESTNDDGKCKTQENVEIVRENEKEPYTDEKDLIPLEEALDLLDNNEDLSRIPEKNEAVLKSQATMENHDVAKEITSENQNDETIEMNDYIENYCEASNNEEPDEESELPEKLSSNVKPQKQSDNLPLHVFLSRKVQESKKRKQQEAKRLQEEQERMLMDFQPTRRQRKCAIGKQGLLAEISSSDDESYTRETCRRTMVIDEKMENNKHARKPKRESKEKRKERYMEKKHEQIIAKEQKAIEEDILRELEKTKSNSCKSDSESCKSEKTIFKDNSIVTEKSEIDEGQTPRTAGKKKRQQKSRKSGTLEDPRNNSEGEKYDNTEKETSNKNSTETKLKKDQTHETKEQDPTTKLKKQSKSLQKTKKNIKISEVKTPSTNRRNKISNSDKTKSKSNLTLNKDQKERRSSCGRRDSDDEELPTTKCWNKVDEGVGVAIGRRKRAAANQLYYWSSSSDDEEPVPAPTPTVEEEDDRQEQHGWIVGDSHKRMITMLAMEKQLKEKRRRSEDEFEPSKSKNKKHRNSTS